MDINDVIIIKFIVTYYCLQFAQCIVIVRLLRMHAAS